MRTRGIAGIAAGLGLALGVWVVFGRSPAPPSRPVPAPIVSAAEPDREPPPSPAPAPAPATPPTASAADSAPMDETALMQRLRAVEDSNPAEAYSLAQEGDRRFPGSADSAERAMIEVKALALEGHLSEARGAAEVMVNKYPGTKWAVEVERHTGAHPHVNR